MLLQMCAVNNHKVFAKQSQFNSLKLKIMESAVNPDVTQIRILHEI